LKIANVKIVVLAGITLHPPFAARAVQSGSVLVSIETDIGITGISEIKYAPMSATIRFICDELAPFLKGQDPLDTERLMHAMLWRFNNRGHSGVWNHAVSALDVALWDIKGKFLKLPVWRLLGGAQRSVPAYVTFGMRSYSREELAEAAKYWVAKGHTRLKMMVARLDARGNIDQRGGTGAQREENPLEDEARVKAVREAVGDSIELSVDAACLLRFEAALRWCDRLQPYGIAWFEEPLQFNDCHLLAELSCRTSIPLAAGQWENFAKLVEMARTGAVSILNPTVGSVGGFTMAAKVAAVGQAFNLPVANGDHFDVHLHAGMPNGWRSEFHLIEWMTAEIIYSGLPEPENGWVTLSEQPGLGFEWREDAIREYQVDQFEA
jgi:L-rhamnonate dehydratase